MPKKRLGDFLMENNLITPSQLEQALFEQKKTGKKLGTILVEMEILTVVELLNILSRNFDLPYVNIAEVAIDERILRLIPKDFIIKNLVLPLKIEEKTLYVAISEPDNIEILHELEFITGKTINPVIAFEWDITKKINELFDGILGNPNEEISWNEVYANAQTYNVNNMKIIYGPDIQQKQQQEQQAKMLARDIKITNSVNLILYEAFKRSANAIYFLLEKHYLNIYYRKNNQNHLLISIPEHYMNAIMERLKLMMQIDVVKHETFIEKEFEIIVNNRPYLMQFKLYYSDKTVNEIASIDFVPIMHKYNPLENIGLSAKILDGVKKIITRMQGLVVITNTNKADRKNIAYTILNRINTGNKLIITLEKSLSFQLDGIKQIRLPEETEYHKALNKIVKLRPDVILIDDIYDLSVVKLALELSAYNIFTIITLNYASGLDALFTLLSLDISKYILANNLKLILAHKNLNRLCTNCRFPTDISPQIEAYIKKKFQIANLKTYTKRGCEKCDNTGYSGKIGIYEYINLNDKNLHNLIIRNASQGEILSYLLKTGFISLKDDALFKMAYGMIDINQVVKMRDEL